MGYLCILYSAFIPSFHTVKSQRTVANKGKALQTQCLQGFEYWQGMRDSNPRKRSQSPVCYRYTNPLSAIASKRIYNYMQFCGKVKQNFFYFFFTSEISRDRTGRESRSPGGWPGAVFLMAGLNQQVAMPAFLPPRISLVRLSPMISARSRVKIRDACEAVVKIRAFGLVVTGRLGDENFAEIRRDACAGETGVLCFRHAVGSKIQVVFRCEIGKDVLCALDKVVPLARCPR